MKRKYPHPNQKKATTSSFAEMVVRDGIIVLFLLELLVAFGIPVPRTLEVAAPVLATIAGGIIVFLNIMSTILEPPHRSPRTVLKTLDKAGCFVLFVISFFGVFWEPVPQFVLWVNVLILSRLLIYAIATFVYDWRAGGKRARTDADCPDKIEKPTNRRDS